MPFLCGCWVWTYSLTVVQLVSTAPPFLIFILKMIIIDISVCLSIIIYLGVPVTGAICTICWCKHTTFLHCFLGMPLDSVNMIGDVLCNTRNDASTWPVHCHISHSKDESKIQSNRLKLWLIGKGLTCISCWVNTLMKLCKSQFRSVGV